MLKPINVKKIVNLKKGNILIVLSRNQNIFINLNKYGEGINKKIKKIKFSPESNHLNLPEIGDISLADLIKDQVVYTKDEAEIILEDTYGIKQKSYIRKNLLALVGLVLGIYSIFLTFNQFKEKEIYCELMSNVISIAKSEGSSKIKILYNDLLIDKDINAINVAVWNNGEEPVLNPDILDSVKIISDDEVEILETKIQKVSRSECKISLTQLNNKEIFIEWSILEEGDGVLFQIIFAGDVENSFNVEGTIKQQKNIKRVCKIICVNGIYS